MRCAFKIQGLLELLKSGKVKNLELNDKLRSETENLLADYVLFSKNSDYITLVLPWIQNSHAREKIENMAFRELRLYGL